MFQRELNNLLFGKFNSENRQKSVVNLTLSWRRPLSYTNQSIDLLRKSMDWFLYDNGLRLERVKQTLLRCVKWSLFWRLILWKICTKHCFLHCNCFCFHMWFTWSIQFISTHVRKGDTTKCFVLEMRSLLCPIYRCKSVRGLSISLNELRKHFADFVKVSLRIRTIVFLSKLHRPHQLPCKG